MSRFKTMQWSGKKLIYGLIGAAYNWYASETLTLGNWALKLCSSYDMCFSCEKNVNWVVKYVSILTYSPQLDWLKRYNPIDTYFTTKSNSIVMKNTQYELLARNLKS